MAAAVPVAAVAAAGMPLAQLGSSMMLTAWPVRFMTECRVVIRSMRSDKAWERGLCGEAHGGGGGAA